MQEEKFELSDESGDKQYFTIIPNYIANHSTANDQALYFQLKKHAGERGECYVSEKTLRSKLGIGRIALKKSLEYLLSHGWIKFNGIKEVRTAGGIQGLKSYKIVDIWKLNSEHYKGVSKTARLEPKGCPERHQRGAPNDNKEDPYIKEDITAKQASPEIPLLIKAFEKVNPSASRFYGNTTQRKACEFLINTYTFDRVLKVVEEALPKTNKMQFFPTIITPVQLQDKWSALESAVAKYQNKKVESKEKYPII